MKHPVANITIEGQGWNPYAVAAEGKDAFTKRVLADGHYLKNEEGLGYTDEDRTALAGKVFDKATEYVAKHTKKAEQPAQAVETIETPSGKAKKPTDKPE